jgi:hypothetical protein
MLQLVQEGLVRGWTTRDAHHCVYAEEATPCFSPQFYR